MKDLQDHRCNPEISWWEYDGRGITLTKVCPSCVEQKLKGFRPEILEYYTQEDVDEPIEPWDEPIEPWE